MKTERDKTDERKEQMKKMTTREELGCVEFRAAGRKSAGRNARGERAAGKRNAELQGERHATSWDKPSELHAGGRR